MNTQLTRDADALSSHLDEWLIASRSHFVPFGGGCVEERVVRRKAFAELALVLYIADRVRPNPGFDPLRSLVCECVTDRRFCDLVARDPRDLDQYCHAIAYVSGYGPIPTQLAHVVRDMLTRGDFYSQELSPHRLLSLQRFCNVTGIGEVPFSVPDLSQFMSIAHPPNPIESTSGDGYVLTHDLFFISDFGFASTPCAPTSHLRSCLPLLVLRHLANNDLDLALELAATAAMVHQLPRRVADLALEAACAEYRSVSRLRSAASSLVTRLHTQGSPIAQWASSYHTMLVATYAFRLILAGRPSDDAIDLSSEVTDLDLKTLGYALCALSRYGLEEGATWLHELRASPLRTEWPEAVDEALAFIRRQRTPDGEYGIFVDELLDHQLQGKDIEAFKASVVAPATAACARVEDVFSQLTVPRAHPQS